MRSMTYCSSLHLVPEHRNREDAERDEVADAHTAREENDAHDERVHHGDREIGLEHDEQIERRRSPSRNGNSPFVSRRIWSPFFTSSIDVHMMTASFPISDG